MRGDTFHASQTRERARADAPQGRVCVSGQRVLGVMHAGGCGPEKWWEGIKEGSVFGGVFCLFVSATLERESSISFSNGTPH